AALIGLYLSQLPELFTSLPRTRELRYWLAVLTGWAVLILLLPFQTPLVSLVGLRGNIFLLTALLLRAHLEAQDIKRLAYGIAALNILVTAFAVGQYFFGVERFYPVTEVTATIYASHDVAGYRFFRIPATFVSSAAYAGTMVVSLPLLFAAWTQKTGPKLRR